MNLGLEGKRAVITASGKGLGKATALRLAEEGCIVVIGSRDQVTLNSAVNEVSLIADGRVFGHVLDLDSPKSTAAFLDFAIEVMGGVDILVNNCGGPKSGYFEDFTDADWDAAYRQVLLSAVQCTRAVLPGMKEQQWGRIVNITSASTKQPIDNLILSTVFRTGLHGLMKTISSQYGAFNITCNNVAPGYILTDRLKSLAEVRAKKLSVSVDEVYTEMASDTSAKRLGKPEEISATVAFLASESAAYITGKTIVVDGGKNKGVD